MTTIKFKKGDTFKTPSGISKIEKVHTEYETYYGIERGIGYRFGTGKRAIIISFDEVHRCANELWEKIN